MTKIDIFSGFLGAGKTTLIKKLIKESYAGQKIVIIENEFGQIGIDGGFLQDSGVQITEMNSGCICCSLVGDFGKALNDVITRFNPDRIVIEPSGVGKLSDVIKATNQVVSDTVSLNAFVTVIDASKCKIYLKNFKEFYENQIEFANTIILSRTKNISKEKLQETINLIKPLNNEATIITTDWDLLAGNQIVDTMEHKNSLSTILDSLKNDIDDDDDDECDDPDCECHHHDDEDEHEHHHHHHHHHDEDEDEHEHHHHHDDDDDDDDEDEDEHEHHHHHHDEDECDDPDCECHHHHHHGHHHADDVFESWGVETSNEYSYEEINNIVSSLNDTEKYGVILRSKAIVASNDQKWIHYDFVPDEINVRYGTPDVTGKICVIGSKLNKVELAKLFKVEL